MLETKKTTIPNGQTVATILFAALTLTVQWGVVTTRLSAVEARMSELVTENRMFRESYSEIDRRLSTLEGMLQRAD
tara:strand:- start:21 stop:248 length:228 start_codon:yes stop_codon:yes gene_type:complete